LVYLHFLAKNLTNEYNTLVNLPHMTSKQPIISSQTPDVPVQPTTPETGSSRVRDIAAGTALSVALLTNPAMAQVKDYYQAYMEQCTAQAAMAQASFREKMNAVIATE
jgi:hypothetical protein